VLGTATLGILTETLKALLVLMNHANSWRVKAGGTARVVEGDAAMEQRLRDPVCPGNVE
jgi:uncharacterized protein